MGGLIVSTILLRIMYKERSKDLLSGLVLAYAVLLFAKVFIGNQGSIIEGLYGFKFNGLYVFFYFGASYILTSFKETKSIYFYTSILLLVTALYGLNQILFGFSGFEQKWIDSIQFTTLRIEGIIRPFSTYLSPAGMADGMTLLFIFGIYWIFSRGQYMLFFGALLILASIPPLLIATVRTNWLAVIAGTFFYVFFLRLKNFRLKVFIILCLSIGIIGYSAKGGSEGKRPGSMVALVPHKSSSKNLTEVMITNRTSALANPLQEYSVQKRVDTWATIIATSFVFPLGKGQGTTGYAHSYFFQVLGEIGYPGLILFISLLSVAYFRGFKILSLSKDEGIKEMTRLILTIMFTLTILNLTGTHLHTPPGDIFFWFSLGVITRFYRKTLDEISVPVPIQEPVLV